MRHEECWAKTTEDGRPGISVRDHCLNVGCVAEALLALLPPQLQMLIPPGAATLAALHDIGKVSPGFQRKNEAWLVHHALRDRALKEGWSMRESDHARISQFTVQELLQSPRLQIWAAAVGTHHGRIKGERVQVQEPWEEERCRLAAELMREFGPLPDQSPGDATIWFVAGLITIADWIGSDERHFPLDARWDVSERRRRAQTALATINWRSVEVRQLTEFAELFPEIPQANSLQTTTDQVVGEPGTYVIEGPMGCGKTEAALAAAHRLIATGKATGLYFALPTQVTSNRIHLRVQPFVDRICASPAAVRLAHSASWLAETDPPAQLSPAIANDEEARNHVHAGRSWFASAKRALLAPFGVGTIDQALLGIVAAKHFFVRQFGLAGKVVILDEVHTYDLYTSTLIDAMAKRLRELQCTVIILSATLTGKRRHELLGLADQQPLSAGYPLVSGVASSLIESTCEAPPAKTIQIRNVSAALPVEEAIDRASDGECLLWIHNTVDEAQETYRALQSANFQGGPSVALLHSRFPFFRREQLETDWMIRLGKDSTNRPNGCILVSTQVAEQSVDIDADLLITDLAPTDMLLQRIGRLWRHDRPLRPCPQPEVWIQMPHSDDASLRDASEKELRRALGKSARVYAPYILLRSLQQWRGRATITLPDDIRPILEATYADPTAAEPPAWQELREQLEKQKEKMARQALNATTIWNNPALPDEEGIQTRFSTYPMAQLLLATEITSLDRHSARLCLLDGAVITAHDRDWNFDAVKAIHRNLVRVPRWAVATGLTKPPGWLTNHVSQPTATGLLQPAGNIRWSGDEQQTGLSYHPDQGIIIERERLPRALHEESDESYD
ncbi:MAG: CRISPR-associated helicase Cas3' [Acidobacteriia bacterium]|nr:CRISPR-associated helicase Cas3' [Terriglobia bacterium]